MRVRGVLSLGVLIVAASACSVIERGADGSWRFDQGSVDGVQIAPAPGEPITLDVSSGAVTGDAGCNDYGIAADVYGGAFDLYPDREITEAECSQPVMEAEEAYWGALQRISVYRVEGDTLELEGEGTYLTFSRAG